MGPPGTGKTLLARAIAGEAGVPFFTISGSDFVEMFVGVGASRVRDLFVQGKKNAPCIIFIDEIDAVGRHRGAGLGGGHDEREQTLNQLLVEMDGFESNEGVILISATNRPDVLDPALLRPGRFDRQVVVSLPDIKGREKILRVHMKKTPIAPDVDPVTLAKGTPGFSGADLENLVNEAALLAAKQDKERVGMMDFEEAKDKVYMGLERKSKVISEEDKKTTAYHEAGHALVARFLPFTDAVNKVTIIPRGRAAGVTWFLPEERDFKYKDQLQSELSVAYGGRVAEELIFNRISTGAAGDIKMATDLASRMVRSWGMSDLGPLSYAKDEEHIFIGREIAQHRDFSEETARRIDEEITKFIDNAYDKAQSVLKDNIDILHRLSEVLLEKETVMGSELDAIILEMRPGFDFPSKHEPVPTPSPDKSEKADEYPEAVSASEAEDATEDSAAEPSGEDESDEKSDDKG
jgi:cell division protease FtsH